MAPGESDIQAEGCGRDSTPEMDHDMVSGQKHSQHLLKGTPFLGPVRAQLSRTYLTLIRQEMDMLLQDLGGSPGTQGQEV